MRPVWTAIAIVLLLPSVVAAPLSGDLSARSISADQATIHGALLALDSPALPDGSMPPFGSWNLTGASVVVATDHEYQNATVAGIPTLPSDTSSESRTIHNAWMESTDPSARSYLFIQGSEAQSTLVGGMEIVRGSPPSERRWVLSDREPLQCEDNALDVHLTTPGTLEIRGDFTIAIWDWRLQYSSDEGDGTIVSGETKSPDGGALADRHLRQVHLIVEDGVARFRLDEPRRLTMHLGGGALESPTRLIAHAAIGAVGGRQAAGSDVEVVGPSSADLRPGPERILLALDGEPAAVVIGGAAVPWPSEPAGKRMPVEWVAGGLVALGALVLGQRVLHAAWIRGAKDALRAGDHGKVVRTGRRIRFGRHRNEALMLVATAAIRLEQAALAERTATAIDASTRAAAAMKEYLLAHVAYLQGDDEQAAKRMKTSYGLDANLERGGHTFVARTHRPEDPDGYV